MRALTKNLRTFLWAFVLALAVWIAAVTTADPDQVRMLPSPLPLEIVGQASNLILSKDIPHQVNIQMRAPASVWDRITSNQSSVRAILDLSGLSDGEHTVNIQVQVSERPVRIVSVSPAQITFTLEPLASRSLKIDLDISGQPAVGYQAGDATLDPQEIVVAGALSAVEKVVSARISVNLDGVRDSIDEAISVELRNANGEVATNLSISPQSVHLTMPIIQQGGYRDLAVKVVVRGQVASGYRLSNLSVFPPVVTIYSSDPNVVSLLPGVVETMPLDLQNASDDITTRLELSLPAGISVVGEQTVLIQAGIIPIQSSLTMSNMPIQVAGLAAGMNAQVLPDTVDVIVSGPLPLLDTLTRQDITVIVDLSGLSAGTHQLRPKVEILISDVSVESILPGTIEVTISSTGTSSAIIPVSFRP